MQLSKKHPALAQRMRQPVANSGRFGSGGRPLVRQPKEKAEATAWQRNASR